MSEDGVHLLLVSAESDMEQDSPQLKHLNRKHSRAIIKAFHIKASASLTFDSDPSTTERHKQTLALTK